MVYFIGGLIVMLLLKKLSRTWTYMVFQSLKVVALC